jgi:hypothetical protein
MECPCTTKSANVLGVTAAGYTSDGWRRSLASARSKAGIWMKSWSIIAIPLLVLSGLMFLKPLFSPHLLILRQLQLAPLNPVSRAVAEKSESRVTAVMKPMNTESPLKSSFVSFTQI